MTHGIVSQKNYIYPKSIKDISVLKVPSAFDDTLSNGNRTAQGAGVLIRSR